MQPIYKCRICGKEFTRDTVDRSEAVQLMKGLVAKEEYELYLGCEVTRHSNHRCSDGSIGFADFIGFREEKVSEKDL